jgi:hypothetical protein
MRLTCNIHESRIANAMVAMLVALCLSVGAVNIGWLTVRSLHAATQCEPSPNQIALFVDHNYGGGCVVRDIGRYRNPAEIGLPNDSISAIKVGKNVWAVLCNNDRFRGFCIAIFGQVADLSGIRFRLSREIDQTSAPPNFNFRVSDSVSSVMVQSLPRYTLPLGAIKTSIDADNDGLADEVEVYWPNNSSLTFTLTAPRTIAGRKREVMPSKSRSRFFKFVM